MDTKEERRIRKWEAFRLEREATYRSCLALLTSTWGELSRPAYVYHSKVGALFLILPRIPEELSMTKLDTRYFLHEHEEDLETMFETNVYDDRYGQVFVSNGPESDLCFGERREAGAPAPFRILVEGLSSIKQISRDEFKAMCDTTRIEHREGVL